MIIFPIRTNIRPYRKPYVNYTIIILNILIFLATYAWQANNNSGQYLKPFANVFILKPDFPQLWQFVTYAFLHANLWHIGGNMFFLYLFGNNVNDKLGHVGYSCLYLAGAVVSGIGHSMLSAAPVLGASGAVAAITGAYLVLFPQTLITVFYWFFFFLDTIEIPALYFIGFKLIVWDNVIERSIPNIAHSAHLSGYFFGIFAMLLLLMTKLIQPNGSDLFSMVKMHYRRRKYKNVVSSGYDPFTGMTKKVDAKQAPSPTQQQKQNEIASLRATIEQRISERNLSEAARLYIELINLDKNQVLSQDTLLDIANHLNSEQMYAHAATAYEAFVKSHKHYPYIEQVELMLGIIYARYLSEPKLAKKHLEKAQPRLSDPKQKEMCQNELKNL
jgi:membrane associated rhomboid family serine protease